MKKKPECNLPKFVITNQDYNVINAWNERKGAEMIGPQESEGEE